MRRGLNPLLKLEGRHGLGTFLVLRKETWTWPSLKLEE